MVKHPAWAAAINSSGFVPFSFSKRVLNEYGVSASTPDSLERLPFPARPVPCQTALALRIMSLPSSGLQDRACRTYAVVQRLAWIVVNRRVDQHGSRADFRRRR